MSDMWTMYDALKDEADRRAEVAEQAEEDRHTIAAQAERIRVLEEALRTVTEQYIGVMAVAYGRDVEKDGNPYVKAARTALKEQP